MPVRRLQGFRAHTTQTPQKSSIIFCQTLKCSLISCFLGPVNHFHTTLKCSLITHLAGLVKRSMLDLYVNFQSLDAWRLPFTLRSILRRLTLDAWRLPLTHIAAHVKPPHAEQRIYHNTREHASTCQTPQRPAHTTQASTCQALRETCKTPAHTTSEHACQEPVRHLPAHTTKTQPSQARTKFRPCQAIYFRAGYWQALAGYDIMSRGGVLKSFCSFRSGSMAASIPPL